MILTESQKKCPIWPNYIATIDDSDNTIRVESARAGGCYTITKTAKEMLNDLDDSSKARLTTLLVNQREQGLEIPEVTSKLLKNAKSSPSLPVHDRTDRLLKYFVGCSKIVGDEVRISYNNHDISKRMPWVQSTELDEVFAMKMWRAMAWSESSELREVFFLTKYLEEKSWIKKNSTADPEIRIHVSIDGYRHINDSIKTVDPAQAFVAIWFDDEMTNAYEEGIKKAVESAGYTPMRIDKKPDVNKIDDEIIAEIRRSRFLVADFTHGKDGARGGVYFEAGFAYGLGLPVIYTCRKDKVFKLHFDTRQYYHIVWEKPADLCRDLKNRIQALIGDGPKKDIPVT